MYSRPASPTATSPPRTMRTFSIAVEPIQLMAARARGPAAPGGPAARRPGGEWAQRCSRSAACHRRALAAPPQRGRVGCGRRRRRPCRCRPSAHAAEMQLAPLGAPPGVLAAAAPTSQQRDRHGGRCHPSLPQGCFHANEHGRIIHGRSERKSSFPVGILGRSILIYTRV